MNWTEWKEQNRFLQIFEEFSKIPHCSHAEEAVSDWLVESARSWGLEVKQDQKKNVYIRKPASPGYESRPPIILQGHMDMVCEKNAATCHDFQIEGIEMLVDGDWLHAKETTLGADNGIAVAYMMAILQDKEAKHPTLECMITTEEETGMGGASVIDGSWFTGKAMINLDSEEEGYALVSCAGGLRSEFVLPVEKKEAEEDWKSYRLDVTGLSGGHSGAEIHHGRGNSNQILGRVLGDLLEHFEFGVNAISGGSKMNAIPREATATLKLATDKLESFRSHLGYLESVINEELRGKDQLILKMEPVEEAGQIWTQDSLNRIVSGLTLCPTGVQTMSVNIPGLVESSNNLGVIVTTENSVVFKNAIRSSVGSLKREIANRIDRLATALGGQHQMGSDYPAWEYREDSPMRDILVDVYGKMTGTALKVTAIHAGLECGILARAIPDLDMISIGPDMKDVHTPKEALNLPSAVRTYNFLLNVLENYND
ncbi:beta-Ala-His dipeptidase [Gottschalkiaceae bacterium SANA]|nr:beta-Ala-His dipeptidase [Gottschalkiaceae bacterium SANA]